MHRILALTWLTWKGAVRFRLFWVLGILLGAVVVGVPLLIKHDGTARGFTQIILTYTLSVVGVLLGGVTLWLACGTLARDIEECQMQLLASKPVPRWQIWFGRWLGLVSLDASLLAACGLAIFGLLQWQSQHLSSAEQATLHSEVLVGRASLVEPAPDVQGEVERIYKERVKSAALTAADLPQVRRQIEEQVKAQFQIVPPGFMRQWILEAGPARRLPASAPLYVRTKFYTAQSDTLKTFLGVWRFGSPESPRIRDVEKSMAAETFHEFSVPADVINQDGKIIVNFMNRSQVALLFPLDEGMEVLYQEAGFGLNFLRGMLLILFWLALLAALGLAASSLLSFPVAAFFSLAVMLVVMGSGTISTAVEEGAVFGRDHESGKAENPVLDAMLLPVFQGVLKVLNLAQNFSPVDSLSAGRSIPWSQVGLAFVRVVLLLGGLLAALGISIFSRRELARPQGGAG